MTVDWERFDSYVDRSGECWVWTRGKDRGGYGIACVGGNKTTRAHRLSYERAYGAPGDLHVLHRCDNPPCVRPDHLFLGTQSDNSKDMWQKGRGTFVVGEGSYNAKLTEVAVRDIRSSTLALRALAKKYGVTKTLIQHVRHRRSWAHVE